MQLFNRMNAAQCDFCGGGWYGQFSLGKNFFFKSLFFFRDI